MGQPTVGLREVGRLGLRAGHAHGEEVIDGLLQLLACRSEGSRRHNGFACGCCCLFCLDECFLPVERQLVNRLGYAQQGVNRLLVGYGL